MRILVIGKNQDFIDKLMRELAKKDNYQVDTALNIKDGRYHIDVRNYDLVLTEWILSDGSAIDLIPIVKGKNSKIPVIVMGDRDAEHEIKSFQNGADDYLTHPLNTDVLIVRIQARLKMWDSNMIEINDMIILPEEERITYKGVEVEVKGKPFEVLTHLARQKGQIVSKDQLLNAIWEEPELVTPNVIEVAINQIRQKLDKPLGINTIETVRRRGYRFCYPSDK